MSEIVVVGSFVQDLTFRCREFPRPGETIIGQFVTGPGGKGSNQAVAAARAGGQVAFIGAVGCDAFGRGAREFQQNEGIAWLAVEKRDHPTGTAAILVNDAGQNQIIVSLDANNALGVADVEARTATLRGAKVVVTQLEANLEAASRAMQIAREGGAMVVLNPAPMRPDFNRMLLTDVDVLIPNETEFCALVAGFDEAKLATLCDADLHGLCRTLGVGMVIVTLGSNGCFVSPASGNWARIPALSGIRAIDTTGAGDAFVGAFATALAETNDLEKAAHFANAAAALSVTKAGTAPAMPSRAEILQHVNDKKS